MSHPSSDINALIQKAIVAREHAYAPYSKYKVGAVVRTRSGKVYTGCNVEFVNYTSVCAERSAIVNAISHGDQEIETVVVVTQSSSFGTPCGNCRQSIAEFNPKATIVVANLKQDYKTYSLDELLPHMFTPKKLREGRPE